MVQEREKDRLRWHSRNVDRHVNGGVFRGWHNHFAQIDINGQIEAMRVTKGDHYISFWNVDGVETVAPSLEYLRYWIILPILEFDTEAQLEKMAIGYDIYASYFEPSLMVPIGRVSRRGQTAKSPAS